MSDEASRPRSGRVPAHIAIVMPPYAPGLHVETSRDVDRDEMVVEVSVSFARQARVAEGAWVRDERPVLQQVAERAVRQIQDEAITALGLNHWRTEVEREVREQERRQRRELLRALAQAVRNAPTTDRAALLVLDELEVMGE